MGDGEGERQRACPLISRPPAASFPQGEAFSTVLFKPSPWGKISEAPTSYLAFPQWGKVARSAG